jgi:hypothetical protein
VVPLVQAHPAQRAKRPYPWFESAVLSVPASQTVATLLRVSEFFALLALLADPVSEFFAPLALLAGQTAVCHARP